MTLRDYYFAVRPFYAAEMSLRSDVAEWLELADRLSARSVLDLGCGTGRIGAAMAAAGSSRRVVGVDMLDVLLDRRRPIAFVRGDMRALPFAPGFDLVAAADDPFAHLLTDDERERALTEARRVLAPGGRAVIDGLSVRETGDFERIRKLGRDTLLTETWREEGDGLYWTRYTYRRSETVVGQAETRVRAWRAGEIALRASGARVTGALDGRRSYDPSSDRFVVVIEAGT